MPKKVIIDTDPGIDDSLAIMLALSMPEEIEVARLKTSCLRPAPPVSIPT